jgi:hypothetical protein
MGGDLMGLRFFRRVRLFPGLRVNLSRSGASVSIGGRGGWLTFGPAGIRTTVGGLGSGIYWTTITPWRRLAAHPLVAHQGHGSALGWLIWLLLIYDLIKAATGLSR